MSGTIGAVAASVGWTIAGEPRIRRWHGWTIEFAMLTAGDRLFLAEAPLGSAFPGYSERMRLRRRIIRQFGDAAWGISPVTIAPVGSTNGAPAPPDAMRPPAPDEGARLAVVFTDAARSRYVWAWDERGSPREPERYRELRVPGQENLLRRLLPAATSGGRPGTALPRHRGADHSRLLRALLPEAKVGGTGARAARQSIAWLRKRASLKDVTSVWNRVERLRIVDMRCGSGDWLMSAGGVVELLYLAIVDRVLAASGEDGARIADGLRLLIQEFEEDVERPSIEDFVRGRIVTRRIFGFDADRRQVRTCRARIRRFAGGAQRFPNANIRALPTGGFHRGVSGSRAEARLSASSLTGGSNDPAHAEEELWIVVRTWLAAVDAREEDRAVGDMRKLTLELERRSRAAIRAMETAGRFGPGGYGHLIDGLAADTGDVFYVRERDGSTRVAGGDGRARGSRVPRAAPALPRGFRPGAPHRSR